MSRLVEMAQALVKQGDDFLSKNSETEFHLKATELLKRADCHINYNYQELAQSSFASDFKVSQNFGSFEFSDLPLTLARGQHCFIDVYFWRRRSTVIHNHHFTGAFQCLSGLNSDMEFTFIKQRQLGTHHALGDITSFHSSQIKPGMVQTIAPLDGFIHQNHHHADLTVNLCFRTPQMPNQSISNYLFSGLSIEKNPVLLERAERLWRFIMMDEIDFRKLNLNLDDALYFHITTDGSESQSQRFIDLKKYLSELIMSQSGVDILKLLKTHNDEFDRLQFESD